MNVARHLLVAILLFFGVVAAAAQSNRSIRFVVPYPPAGTADIVARLLGEQIGRTGGPTFVIENRPGGGTTIASDVVSRAAPDGNTLLFISSEFVITPHLHKVNYDPVSSFEPICQLVTSPTVIVVADNSPYRTLNDWLKAARSKPGELTMASTGVFQVAIEQLKQAAKANFIYVPYAGNAAASNALLGGHISSLFAVYPTVAGLVKSGKLRALAVASKKRIAALPNVPTVIEQGYTDYEIESWSGVLAPAKTPGADIAQLTRYFTAALNAPEIKAKLVTMDSSAIGECGPAFVSFIRKQYDETGRIIREANIKGR